MIQQVFSKITISGKIGTGKSSVFRELKKKLNWPTFSSGTYFRKYAKTHHLKLNNAEEQTDMLTRKVDNRVGKMLRKPGNLLVDAWLGGILAHGVKDVFKVLLVADDVTRFKRFAQREKISIEEAQKEVLLRDTSWFEKVKKIYKCGDFFDEKNYDLIINTTNLSKDKVIEMIIKKFNLKCEE